MYSGTSNYYAPQGQTSSPTYTYTPRVTPGRVQGGVSRYREATITLTQTGIQFDGRAVWPLIKQIPFMILGLPLRIGPLLVALLFEYAIRSPESDSLPWSSIEEIVLEPDKSRVCIVYANPAKPTKLLSLAFKLELDIYENFVQAARYFAVGKIRTGKIGSAMNKALFIILGVLLLFVFGLIIWTVISPHPRPGE